MISIVGGTYKEVNLDTLTNEYFGSGLRGVTFLLENNVKVEFYTAGNDEVERYLTMYKNSYNEFSFECNSTDNFITFKYCFALDLPVVYPSLRNIGEIKQINIEKNNIICFGMVEAEFVIKGENVIYDPQTSLQPRKFSEFGKADKLIYIVNLNEAIELSNKQDIDEIVNFFFDEEAVHALIIKDGPYGAKLYTEEDRNEHSVPAFITKNVFKIGSGDIFTTSFGYYWLEKKLNIKDAALCASKATALFCDKKILKIEEIINSNFDYNEFTNRSLKNKQVYIASPIFSLSDLIFVEKIRNTFLDFGVKVFSPFHDVGLGNDVGVAWADLNALNESDIIFSVADNNDSGTLVELGYGMAKNKKIICYHRTCDDKELLMLRPSGFKVFNNLTSAIYNTIWEL